MIFEALLCFWRNSRGWERAFVIVLIYQGQDSIKVGAIALGSEAKVDPETLRQRDFDNSVSGLDQSDYSKLLESIYCNLIGRDQGSEREKSEGGSK